MSNPISTKVPLYLKRGNFQINVLNMSDINRVFREISLRINQLEGIGQNIDARGRNIRNLRAGSLNSDVIRLDQALLKAGFNIDVDTFANGDLVAGAYTFAHDIGRVPYFVQVWNGESPPEQISPDTITVNANSVVVDLSSWGVLSGTFTVICGG